LKSVVELWGEGRTYLEVAASFAAKRKALEHFFCDEVSFRVRMDCFSKKCTPEKQREILDNVDFLPFKGKVNLKSPDVTVSVHEDYGPSSNSAPSQPLRVFIGRRIGSGQRHLSKLYSIKTRYFIGNTTMDPQLSLIMANQAKVTHSSLVFDPFVGSGEILDIPSPWIESCPTLLVHHPTLSWYSFVPPSWYNLVPPSWYSLALPPS
jgi:tRNA (guanine10-N2)-methyltransferase